MFFWILIVIIALTVVALWRNEWDFAKAWASLLALAVALGGVIVSWATNGGSTP